MGKLAGLVLKRTAGRTGAGDITLFKSFRLALEDLVAEQHAYARTLATSTDT